MTKPYSLMATAAFGLEAVVSRELQNLGFTDLQTENGAVHFQGDHTAIARANLWLRTADRVVLVMGRFHADTFDGLFEQTKALPWPDLLPRDANFPVEGRSVKSQLASVPACQSIVKKAIVESMKSRYGLETFPETGPRFNIEVAIHHDEVVLSVDTSGAALHKRGYRSQSGPAPIKETLAAAMVLLSRWGGHRPFADPLCGTGTIAIEAAWLGLNIAPGLRRSFASEAWGLIDDAVWQQTREEAEDVIDFDAPVHILASDIDEEAVRLTTFHCRQAGVSQVVRVERTDVGAFRPTESYGCIVTNPPYGERLGEAEEVEQLYRTMGKTFRRLDTWSAFVITSHPKFERLYGKPADKKRKLYNGRIQTNLYQYLGPLPPRRSQAPEA